MDLIADVLNNADAAKLKLATLRLTQTQTKIASGETGREFQRRLNADRAKLFLVQPGLPLRKDQSRLQLSADREIGTKESSRSAANEQAMQGLEAVLATKMIESMMPKDQESIYGKGTSGEVWRGFHIEQMGKAIASQKLFGSSSEAIVSTELSPSRHGGRKQIVPFAG
jgi:peptidoglycan hydrolase FlgJ